MKYFAIVSLILSFSFSAFAIGDRLIAYKTGKTASGLWPQSADSFNVVIFDSEDENGDLWATFSRSTDGTVYSGTAIFNQFSPEQKEHPASATRISSDGKWILITIYEDATRSTVHQEIVAHSPDHEL